MLVSVIVSNVLFSDVQYLHVNEEKKRIEIIAKEVSNPSKGIQPLCWTTGVGVYGTQALIGKHMVEYLTDKHWEELAYFDLHSAKTVYKDVDGEHIMLLNFDKYMSEVYTEAMNNVMCPVDARKHLFVLRQPQFRCRKALGRWDKTRKNILIIPNKILKYTYHALNQNKVMFLGRTINLGLIETTPQIDHTVMQKALASFDFDGVLRREEPSVEYNLTLKGRRVSKCEIDPKYLKMM